ncbi:MAG: metal ABC transporter permease [Gammaproteobacteria bacterium]|nr:metal ABC transporter permease [Gammaproteobacteria bacterium]MDH3767356.1 metal ABC transporter permease [Gammaproteobacteria bacterium]
MSQFFEALASQVFMQYALAAGLLASLACGIIGPYVIVMRLGLLAGGIAHALLGGMGVAYFLGQSPLAGALITAVLAALIIGWVRLQFGEDEDTIIAAIWAVGMALGVLFISRTPGYTADLMSYLFGNILLIGRSDLIFLAVLNAIIIGIVTLFYKQFLAVAFDEEFARARGIRVRFFYLLMLVLVALTIVVLIRVVGLILVIALLTLPAAIARQFAGTLYGMMLLASLIGAALTFSGLAISYGPNLPSGATIIVLAGLSYFTVLILRRQRR